MEGKSYEDRLRYLGLWTFEEKRNRQDLIELFKILRVYLVFKLMNCLCGMRT